MSIFLHPLFPWCIFILSILIIFVKIDFERNFPPFHSYSKKCPALCRKTPTTPASAWRAITHEQDMPGCRFHTRCPYATECCRREVPQLRPVAGRLVACHRAEELHRYAPFLKYSGRVSTLSVSYQRKPITSPAKVRGKCHKTVTKSVCRHFSRRP